MSNNERSEKLANEVSPKTVTAQEIVGLFSVAYTWGEHKIAYDLQKLDALLSRARQESRREALKEMDDVWKVWEKAYVICNTPSWYASPSIDKLRAEYNQP